jgi:hypothetical protein
MLKTGAIADCGDNPLGGVAGSQQCHWTAKGRGEDDRSGAAAGSAPRRGFSSRAVSTGLAAVCMELMPNPAERMLRLLPALTIGDCMPVTAKLSKRFYDVLGEDVANELVDWFNAVDLSYRTDLRELNELNFARFDAKLEQRLAELRAELRQEIEQLRTELRTGLHSLRADLLRWMFGFWVSTVLMLGGLMVAFRGP